MSVVLKYSETRVESASEYWFSKETTFKGQSRSDMRSVKMTELLSLSLPLYEIFITSPILQIPVRNLHSKVHILRRGNKEKWEIRKTSYFQGNMMEIKKEKKFCIKGETAASQVKHMA